jgi:acetyltransferase-like isoleucine patch superfamily enzyme
MSYLAHVPNPGYTQLNVGRFSSLGPNLYIPMPGHPIEALSTSVFTYSRGHKIVQAALTDGHDSSDTEFALPSLVKAPQKGEAYIGNDVWVGANVTLMPGVTIGNGAVIATGAVITKDIPDYEIWGGNPAKLIKKRFSQDTIAILKALQWWRFHPRDLAQFKMQTPEEFIKDFLPAHGALEPYIPDKINLWNKICEIHQAEKIAIVQIEPT